ncbi:MAG: CBS domain-containing protein [Firmicutes bacterium]|nr:CBS domain-containing protein [Bacillota bacterium]
MMVKTRMTPDPVTAAPDMGVLDALKHMQRNKVRRLPILDKDRLVGIVVESQLLKVAPSPATTLSAFEVNYLLSKMTLKDVMTRNPVTVTPDTLIEEAAVLMWDNVVSGLPVLDGDQLVGIITETNIFDAFIDSMGLRQNGTRLAVEAADKAGVLADITAIIRDHDISIISLSTFHQKDANKRSIVLRLDTTELDGVEEALESKGYEVVHVAYMASWSENNRG